MRQNTIKRKSRYSYSYEPTGNSSGENKSEISNPWTELAAAVVLMAAKDYESMVKSANPSSVIQRRGEDAENFLKSQRCMIMTSIDGNYILRKIKEEYKNDRNK